MIHTYELTAADGQSADSMETAVEQVLSLMHALSEHPSATKESIRATIASEGSHLFVVADEDCIVGCATLCTFWAPMGQHGSVEDVVVSPAYRGRGLGRALMESVIAAARRMAPMSLILTSRPHRTAARALYQSLGFQPKETGVFTMKV